VQTSIAKRHPCDALGRIEGNRVWNNHNASLSGGSYDELRLIGYFKGNPAVTGAGISFVGGANDVVIAVEEIFGFRDEYPSGQTGGWRIDQPIGGPNQVSQYPNEIVFSANRLPILSENIQAVMNNLGSFGVGDYIWVSGTSAETNPSHGFMIVDTGPAIPCDDFVPENSVDIALAGSVFYVADIPATQRGTPRPFYCSRMYDSQGNGNFFNFPEWHFIRMPDSVSVERSRLFSPNPINQQ